MKNIKSNEIYGIVSHDAGGAEILSDWVKHHKGKRYLFSLKGPAVKIFKKKNLLKKNYDINYKHKLAK